MKVYHYLTCHPNYPPQSSVVPTQLLNKVLSFTETECLVSVQFAQWNGVFNLFAYVDKPSTTVHKPSVKQQANHDTLVVEELTSMDIRTQMILKR